MKKLLKKLTKRTSKTSSKPTTRVLNRSEIERKVAKCTEKAISEYGYVFRKLAEFDRT